MVNSNALPMQLAKNSSTQGLRWQRTPAKIILGSHLYKSDTGQYLQFVDFLQLPPGTYYFLFRRRDGWMPIYTKQFVPSAPVLFSFAAFPFIIKHKHKKVQKWCLTTCDVEITWKLNSIWMSFVLRNRMRHPWLLFRTCIKLNPHFVCCCLTPQNFCKIRLFKCFFLTPWSWEFLFHNFLANLQCPFFENTFKDHKQFIVTPTGPLITYLTVF